MRPTIALVSAAVISVLLTCTALLSSLGGATGADDLFPEVQAAPLQVATTAQEPVQPEPSKPAPSPDPDPRGRSPKVTTPDLDELRTALRKERGRAMASALVFDRQNGRTLFEEASDHRFRSASLVKLMIAIDALDRRTLLAGSDALRRMLALSDDQQASALWTANGGTQIVRRVASKLDLDTQPPQIEGRWGDTLISARDVLAIYTYILDEMPQANSGAILAALRSAPGVGADGFRQHFGIPDGLPGLPWAIKQGWSVGGGSMELHTSGLVGDNDRYIVVVLTKTFGRAQWEWGTRMVTEVTAILKPLLR